MENLACDLRFSFPTEQGSPTPGPRTSTMLGTQLQSRRWAVSEPAKFHLHLQLLPSAVFPPELRLLSDQGQRIFLGAVRSGAALDFPRSSYTAVNCICMKSRFPALWESFWNHSPPASIRGKIVFHGTRPWCQKGWGPLLKCSPGQP